VPATVVWTTNVVVVDGAEVSGEFSPKGMSIELTSSTGPDFGTAQDASKTHIAPI
jgi:hypothetical protein